jgi:glycosyltransferase involved in cell wall biosynthesis
VVLTWNRSERLRETLETLKEHHDVADGDLIVVDNGSTDGTQEYLRATSFDRILSRENLGAQAGKLLGWQRAVSRGFEFILFVEDDHPCLRQAPLGALENYLDENPDVGQVRLNDKDYIDHHTITRFPIDYQEATRLNEEFTVQKCSYHFTSHPALFRASLVDLIKGCAVLDSARRRVDFETLGFDKYRGTKPYRSAKRRVSRDFGIREKEYMRRYLLHYRLTARLSPACFHWRDDEAAKARKHSSIWRN